MKRLLLLCCLMAAALPALALKVSPNPAQLGPGESIYFSAQEFETDASISWEVIPASLGKIGPNGLFTAAPSSGQGMVRAIARSRDGRITLSHALIKIEAGKPARLKVDIAPAPAELKLKERVRFTCQVLTPKGTPAENPTVVWQVIPGKLGSIDQEGNFIPLMPGQGRIVARVSGPNAKGLGQTAIMVSDDGQPLQVDIQPVRIKLSPGASAKIAVQVRDASGQPVEPRIKYSLSPSTLGNIDEDGNLTAGSSTGLGLLKVQATAGNRQGTGRAMVTIEPYRHKYSVRLKPRQATVEPGASLQLELEVRDQDGRGFEQPKVYWRVIPQDIGTISPQGLFTAGERAGYGRIVASLSEGEAQGQDAATVRIVNRSRNQIRISPAKSDLRPGQMVQFIARISNQQGKPENDTPVRWIVSPPGLGTINQQGLFTAGSLPGNGMIIAEVPEELGGGQAAAPITISSYQLKLIAPSNPYIIDSGDQVQFTAILRDANGNNLSGSAEFQWEIRSSVQNFGNIDRSTGLFKAGNPAKLPAEGYVTVKARINGQSVGADGIKIIVR